MSLLSRGRCFLSIYMLSRLCQQARSDRRLRIEDRLRVLDCFQSSLKFRNINARQGFHYLLTRNMNADILERIECHMRWLHRHCDVECPIQLGKKSVKVRYDATHNDSLVLIILCKAKIVQKPGNCDSMLLGKVIEQ